VIDFILPSTVILIAAAGALLRKARPLWRWLAAFAIFLALTASWMLATGPPQSLWLSVPAVGAATIGGVFLSSRGPFQDRPLIAFAVGAGGGLLVGMIVAIEMGLLVP
jgi:hypothetical protein